MAFSPLHPGFDPQVGYKFEYIIILDIVNILDTSQCKLCKTNNWNLVTLLRGGWGVVEAAAHIYGHWLALF